MNVLDKPLAKRSKTLPLYDSQGNPSEFLLCLKSIYEKGDWDVYNLFSGMSSSEIPIGLSSKQVWQMAHAKGRRKYILEEHYKFLEAYFLKTNDSLDEFVYVSPNFKIKALEKIKNSSLSPKEYLRGEKSLSNKLSLENIIEVLESKDRWIPRTCYNFVKEDLSNGTINTLLKDDTIIQSVTKSFKTRVRKNIRWSEKKIEDYFLDKDLVPEGLTKEDMMIWLESDILEYPARYIDFIKRNWCDVLPAQLNISLIKPEVIVVNKQVADLIIKEVHRTGIPFTKALKLAQKIPKGLLPRTIRSWFELKHKCYPVAKREYVDFVINLYQSLPDKEKL